MNEINEIARVNPLCVISKATFGEYAVHDIQTNTAWSSNPYGEDYATVPDDMVEAVMETNGFLDPVFNEDGTELVSFTAREKPVIEYAPATGEHVTICIDFGPMPSSGVTKCVAHSIAKLGNVLSLRGSATSADSYLTLPCEGASLSLSGAFVCIACGDIDLTAYTDVRIWIEYEVG